MRFIETLKMENGVIQNLKYHNLRFNQTRNKFYNSEFLDLSTIVENRELARVRITYDKDILAVEYFEIIEREFEKFGVVECDDISYSFKYENRELLNKLKNGYDEIIIIKNGLVTDTTISNLAFFDGEKWVTPKNPLLKGTMRAKLLDEKKLVEANIDNFDKFQKFAMMNAIIGFKEFDIIKIKKGLL